jgi:hypothetical protein
MLDRRDDQKPAADSGRTSGATRGRALLVLGRHDKSMCYHSSKTDIIDIG